MTFPDPDETTSIPQIGSVRESRVFTLHEARELFPLVSRITNESEIKLKPIRLQLENMLGTDPRIKSVEIQYEQIVKSWVDKMERFGLVVKGLWLVDFDTGDGFFCWKYPEQRLGFYHDYTEGFANRRPIEDVLSLELPDWA